MPDIAIKPVNSFDSYARPQRLVPTYLVTLEGKKGKDEHFIAVKFDDAYVNWGKFVGFYIDASLEEIVENYSSLIDSTDATKFVEMMWPITHIKSVRSLVYRHKIGAVNK